MDVTARVTAKGQVTIPKAVRDALTIREGDEVVFRVERNRAILARSARLLELAGAVAVPAGKRGRPWAEVVADTRRSRATRRA
ncbi:MAG: AbrB/MazE/SpoVT family DNA-binding domain-containing protein [Dehalococcoidia bacterium]|nr:AbrB/MazE/SpoVT family DNA-binding domain-containing protein [Dehalococcoidia bacterium]